MTRLDLLDRYNDLYRGDSYGNVRPAHRLMLNQQVLLQQHGVKSIFDIGCGRGVVIRAMKEFGFLVGGTEPAPGAHDDLDGLDVYAYMAHELKFLEELSQDFVFSIDVFDHLSSEADVEVAMTHTLRLARVGFGVLINGYNQMQTIHWSVEKWKDWIEDRFGSRVEQYSRKNAGTLFVGWCFEGDA